MVKNHVLQSLSFSVESKELHKPLKLHSTSTLVLSLISVWFFLMMIGRTYVWDKYDSNGHSNGYFSRMSTKLNVHYSMHKISVNKSILIEQKRLSCKVQMNFLLNACKEVSKDTPITLMLIDLHENETACRTHFHMKGFALKLVLKQRHKRTRK